MKTDTMLMIAAGVGAFILINSLTKKEGQNSFATNIGQEIGHAVLDTTSGFVFSPYTWGEEIGKQASDWVYANIEYPFLHWIGNR